MFLTDEIKVHKTDGVTRQCQAAKVLGDGSLAVWDNVPDDEYGFAIVSPGTGFQLVDRRTDEIIEPDIVVGSDKWERVERDGHSWKQTSPAALKERAKRRDDVDEDELNI